MENQTPLTVLYTYRYVWKNADDKIYMRHMTDVAEGHDKMVKALLSDDSVKSCYREYLGEYDTSHYAQIDELKKENKKWEE